MLRSFFSAILMGLSSLAVAPPEARAEQVSVFAAASLQEALSDVISGFEAASGHEVVASFAGSSALARQVQYGAPADVVMLANVNWMTYLQERGLLQNERGKSLFGNGLSLVVPVSSEATLEQADVAELSQILNSGRIAMALVEAVPAGIYGKEALTSLGLWDTVQPNVVETDNVRAALALVALGEVSAGIVYTTDAMVDDRVRIVAQFPADSHSEIVYPAAIVAGQDRPEVVEFMTYLSSQAAQDAFVQRGFLVLEEAQ
ncbi:molybdate ABC transporter substrate-binding protein [Shimia sp. MIT1388]|uniref:molybdate ABC transporter substrate-binding protein n=1 Tax=Shimia sp. MIT1388 TaxID=3096992 RepID=UPI00399A0946